MDPHQKMAIDEKLAQLGIRLPAPPAVAADHDAVLITGNEVYVSGHLPIENGRLAVTGRLGAELDVATARQAARLCFLGMLAQLEADVPGGLDAISHVVRLGGFVCADPGAADLTQVMDGASELAIALFGKSGRHVRSVVGVTVLPMNAAVMVEGLFRL